MSADKRNGGSSEINDETQNKYRNYVKSILTSSPELSEFAARDRQPCQKCVRTNTTCGKGPLEFRCNPCDGKRRTCSWKQDFVVEFTVKHFKFTMDEALKMYENIGRSLKGSMAASGTRKAGGLEDEDEEEEEGEEEEDGMAKTATLRTEFEQLETPDTSSTALAGKKRSRDRKDEHVPSKFLKTGKGPGPSAQDEISKAGGSKPRTRTNTPSSSRGRAKLTQTAAGAPPKGRSSTKFTPSTQSPPEINPPVTPLSLATEEALSLPTEHPQPPRDTLGQENSTQNSTSVPVSTEPLTNSASLPQGPLATGEQRQNVLVGKETASNGFISASTKFLLTSNSALAPQDSNTAIGVWGDTQGSPRPKCDDLTPRLIETLNKQIEELQLRSEESDKSFQEAAAMLEKSRLERSTAVLTIARLERELEILKGRSNQALSTADKDIQVDLGGLNQPLGVAEMERSIQEIKEANFRDQKILEDKEEQVEKMTARITGLTQNLSTISNEAAKNYDSNALKLVLALQNEDETPFVAKVREVQQSLAQLARASDRLNKTFRLSSEAPSDLQS